MFEARPTRNFLIASIGLAALWLATVLFAPLRGFVDAHLVLSAQSAPQLELWAPLTYVFFPRDFLMLAFNVLMLYFFGTDLDERWSAKKWWGVALIAGVVGGVVAMPVMWLVGSKATLGGFSAPVMAFVAVYCWRVWTVPLHLFGIRFDGKKMLIAFLAFDALFALFALDPSVFVARVGATGVGLLVAMGGVSQARKSFHYWRVRRRMKIVARTPEDPRKTDDGEWLN